MELFPSYGGAPFASNSKKVIRLILKGCANRPFFHISVQEKKCEPQEPVIEQIGNYDPLPNQYNEKLVAINFDRLEFWLRQGAKPTVPVAKLLGLCGYFPVHPSSLQEAYLKRKTLVEEIKNLKIKAAEFGAFKEENESVQESSELNFSKEHTSVATEEQASSASKVDQSTSNEELSAHVSSDKDN